MKPVRLKPATPPFRVKHSTIEPLGSLDEACVGMMVLCLTGKMLRRHGVTSMEMLCNCYEQV